MHKIKGHLKPTNNILDKQAILNDAIHAEPGAGKKRAAAGIQRFLRYVTKVRPS